MVIRQLGWQFRTALQSLNLTLKLAEVLPPTMIPVRPSTSHRIPFLIAGKPLYEHTSLIFFCVLNDIFKTHLSDITASWFIQAAHWPAKSLFSAVPIRRNYVQTAMRFENFSALAARPLNTIRAAVRVYHLQIRQGELMFTYPHFYGVQHPVNCFHLIPLIQLLPVSRTRSA